MARRSPFAGSSDLVALGLATRELRESRGLQQRVVEFDAGLCRQYVSNIELGYVNPQFLTVLALTRTIRTPLSELAGVYEQKLALIDPRAGQGAPACPTPGALAYMEYMNALSRSTHAAAETRRARSRMRRWT